MDKLAEKLLLQCQNFEKNEEKIVLELKKEREKLGNSGVLDKISDYLIEKIKESK